MHNSIQLFRRNTLQPLLKPMTALTSVVAFVRLPKTEFLTKAITELSVVKGCKGGSVLLCSTSGVLSCTPGNLQVTIFRCSNTSMLLPFTWAGGMLDSWSYYRMKQTQSPQKEKDSVYGGGCHSGALFMDLSQQPAKGPGHHGGRMSGECLSFDIREGVGGWFQAGAFGLCRKGWVGPTLEKGG